jgi:hypothetical protein
MLTDTEMSKITKKLTIQSDGESEDKKTKKANKIAKKSTDVIKAATKAIFKDESKDEKDEPEDKETREKKFREFIKNWVKNNSHIGTDAEGNCQVVVVKIVDKKRNPRGLSLYMTHISYEGFKKLTLTYQLAQYKELE